MLKLNREGDTLVEVLIAIAIVSLVLATAYAITNRNTIAIQSSQERIQAQHLVESQIEALMAAGNLNNSGDCFVNGQEVAPTDPGNPCDDFQAAGSGAKYALEVDGPDPDSNAYTITATWTDLQNSSTPSTVTMYYRLN